MNILVIEDDKAMLRALKMVLNRQGYKVFLASSEANAINRMRENTVDCIVSDIHLPGKPDLLSMVQNLKRHSHAVPVVLISSNPTNPNIDNSLLLGADAFLPKPLDFDLLVDVIERLTHQTAGQ